MLNSSMGLSKLFLISASLFLAACDNKFDFQEVFNACAPPASSARYGKNKGPVIMTPDAGVPFNGKVEVGGTCEPGFPVVISGGGIEIPVDTQCNNGIFSATLEFNNGEGSKEIDVAQKTSETQTTFDRRCFNQDTVAPKVNITGTGGTLSVGSSTVNIEGSCESGLEVVISGPSISNTATTSCNRGRFSTPITFIGADGLKDVVATQVDPAGNNGDDNEVYTIDTIAPIVTIDSPSAGSPTSGLVTVVGSCEDGLDLIVTGTGVAGGGRASCVSGNYSIDITLSGPDGLRNVLVTQTDEAGNEGRIDRDFMRDTTAPAVAITSPASGAMGTTGLTVAGTCEVGSNVILSGDISTVTTNCSGGTFSSPIVFSNGDGAKNVVATQTDNLGNIGSDNRTFIRDTSAPIIRITSPAAGTSGATGLVVSGTCERGLEVVLSGNINTVTTKCSGKFSQAVIFTGVDGTKNIVATQADALGNRASDNRNFVKDTTGPSIRITSPIAGTAGVSGLTLSGTCEPGLAVSLAGDIRSVSTTCAAGSFTAAVVFTGSDGSKNIVASQKDALGNTGSDNRNFTKDSAGPAVAITAPATNTTAVRGLTVSGICESGLNVALSGDISSTSTSCSGGAFSVTILFSNGDGRKNVVASQTDALGNKGTDNRNFVKDSLPPNIAITAPAANTAGKPGLTVSGTCETGLNVVLSGDINGRTTICFGGKFSQAIIFTGPDGNKNVVASQTDALGNSASDNRIFRKDSSAPSIAIVSPAVNTAAQSGLTVSGTCEAPLVVVLTGDINSINARCRGNRFAVPVVFTGADGIKTVVATQTDQSGNSASDRRNFIKDSTGPRIVITSPAAGSSTTGSLLVGGTCETGLVVNMSGEISSATAPCLRGSFSVNIALAGRAGSKRVVASQTDALGNTSSSSRNFNLINASGFFSFTSEGPGGKVDILFVDDNSPSMEEEQRRLGSKFGSFTTALAEVDWQVGITTTDCSSGTFGICGSLLNMTGTRSYILNKKVPNFLDIFKSTIQRPETFDPLTGESCIITGLCPSGNEQGLLASITAMQKRNGDNRGFFRTGADLAIVFLSDEDEENTGPASATTAAQVISAFGSTWPSGKKFSSHGIIIRPGDSTCLNTQRSQFGGNGFYGTRVQGLADATGGRTVSICEPDYSLTLQQIGEDVTRLSNSVDLPDIPKPGSVRITYTPAHTTRWSIAGNRITFANPAPFGTLVEISYDK